MGYRLRSKNPWSRFERCIDAAGRIPGYAVGLVTLGISADIVSRNVGLGPIGWMLEAVEYLLYVLTLVGAPYLMLRGGHVAVDIVVNSLSPGARAILVSVGAAIAAAISGVLVWVTISAALQAFNDGATIYKTFVVKEWVLLSLLPLSFSALTAVCARLLWLSLRSARDASGGSGSAPR